MSESDGSLGGKSEVLAAVSLGSLRVDPDTPQWSIAYDINDNGLIVGGSNGHAVLWSGGVIQDLNTIADGLPAGAVLTEARAIRPAIVGAI